VSIWESIHNMRKSGGRGTKQPEQDTDKSTKDNGNSRIDESRRKIREARRRIQFGKYPYLKGKQATKKEEVGTLTTLGQGNSMRWMELGEESN